VDLSVRRARMQVPLIRGYFGRVQTGWRAVCTCASRADPGDGSDELLYKYRIAVLQEDGEHSLKRNFLGS